MFRVLALFCSDKGKTLKTSALNLSTVANLRHNLTDKTTLPLIQTSLFRGHKNVPGTNRITNQT